MKLYSADFIFDVVNVRFLQNHVLIMNGAEVEDFLPLDSSHTDVHHFEGILCPGFVNSHCHLELSHMKGIIPSGTGLINFLTKVVNLREFPILEIQSAIENADREMFESGIVAVGDISNTADTVDRKRESSIRYYNFTELFDLLNPAITAMTIERYAKVYAAHEGSKSYVPHAPYTVTKGLFDFIKTANKELSTVSIHNQEVADENALFIDGGGRFEEF